MWLRCRRGAPQICADRGTPLPNSIRSVLAQRVNDGAASGAKRPPHLGVRGLHQARLLGLVIGSLSAHHVGFKAAQVVLQVVDAHEA